MRYTRVSVTVLDRLVGLPAETKATYFALLFGPHRTSAPGLFRAGPAALAETCETTPEAFAASIAVLVERGLIMADFSSRVMFLPHAIEDDPPSNPSVVRSWRKVLDEMPSCDVKTFAAGVLRERAGHFATDEKGADLLGLDTVPGTVRDTVSDTVPAPCPHRASTPTPTPTPTPSPTPTEEGSLRGETISSPLRTPDESTKRETHTAARRLHLGSVGGGAEDSEDALKGEDETGKDIPSGIPSTPDELIRRLAEDGITATQPEANEFFRFFTSKGWKHGAVPFTAANWHAAFTWHRARLQRDETLALKKKAA